MHPARENITFHVIGTPRLITCEGKHVYVRPREAALLAYVGSQPHGCTKASITALLWPSMARDRAKRSLSQLLYSLRARYGIKTEHDSTRVLFHNVVLDLTQIESYIDASDYVSALALLNGRCFDLELQIGQELNF